MPEKKRTTFLTVWLILMLISTGIGILANIFLLAGGAAILTDLLPPTWAIWVSLVLAIVDILFIALMFKGKKIGLYGYLTTWVITVVISLSYLGFTGSAIFNLIMQIIFLGILLLAVKPNWKNFK